MGKGVVTAEMRRMLDEQQLGFVATVCPDGTPNLSPKGTTACLDSQRLVFADIHSPQTVANLRANPAVEINVVDALSRRGYRFKGVATVLDHGPEFDRLIDFYQRRGSTSHKHHIVVVNVEHAAPLFSPAYDDGRGEAEISARWQEYWTELWRGRARRPAEPRGWLDQST
jgi:predicted pyridoxine 5'-phosphate oxidase superfamily flavin-nucleotide-binding protein